MLRKVRILLAVLSFVIVTALFLDFTGVMHRWFGWMAKIQFVPAVLALNVVAVVLLVALTLVFGRVYCSVICPLGIFQDIVARIGRRKKKLPYTFSPERRWLRIAFLVLMVVTLVAGLVPIAALLDPYASYGRIASNFFQPVYRWANNLLAYASERYDSYAFYSVDVWLKSLPTLIVAGVSAIVVAVLAWRGGRTYCNTVCPVGTVLGYLSKFSLLKPVINTDKCVGCGVCARKCKASCIDSKQHAIDYTRCVACMDCLNNCSHHAISYSRRRRTSETPKVDKSRRGFIATAATVAVASALRAEEKAVDGGLAAIADKQLPERATRLVPPGAQSIRHFAQHCTACQLCISACPNGVLRPSGDLATLMQPEMQFDRGYCRPECTECSQVCPAGAIRAVTAAEKTAIHIGHAVWIRENCLPSAEGVSCGNCARHCPVGAITMVPINPDDEESLRIPAVDTERCIGCGACENLCPARPFSAIYVEGNERHRVEI
ncbi:MAG: 4Fe-4S dicluster domain-containing protein [Candidatus Limisoma sp.]